MLLRNAKSAEPASPHARQSSKISTSASPNVQSLKIAESASDIVRRVAKSKRPALSMARSIAKFHIRWIIGQDRKVAKLEKRDVATIMNTRITRLSNVPFCWLSDEMSLCARCR